MRRLFAIVFVAGLFAALAATPAVAGTNTLTPLPGGEGHWLTTGGGEVDGSSGHAVVNNDGATVSVHATGLEPGHAYTMWIVYFNDGGNDCEAGETGPNTNCGLGDLFASRGGIVYGDGKVVGGNGTATFTGRVNVGDGPDIGPPGVVSYDPENPDFHVIVRSHGPKIKGMVSEQTHSVEGGCDVEVPAGETPDASGECGDVQLYIFETIPAP